MKIIIVETVIDGDIIGGGNLYLPGLMKGLVRKGHDVHLVVKGKPNERVNPFIEESGAKVHLKPWGKKGLMKDMAPRLADWVNQQEPDVYVISGSYDIGWLALPFIDPSIATFAIAHSNTDNFYFPVKHYGKFITTAIGVSDEICRKFEEKSQMPADRIQWIPYGIKPAATLPDRSNDKMLRIVFAGRLEEYQKRISDVKKIIQKLGTTGIDFHFSIIGDGSMFEDLKTGLAEQISKGQVTMHGWMQGEQVLSAFKESDIFILTSDSEGFSISLIEAMANGCCPVVTDIPSGSTQLITPGVNGYLIPVGDLDAFVQQFVSLSNNRNTLDELRKGAWEIGKQFNVERMVQSYIDCFELGRKRALSEPRKTDKEFVIMESCRSRYPDWLRRAKLFLLNESGFSN